MNTFKSSEMSAGEFTALSACTMMLTALGIDIMLPAFAQVRVHFGLSPQSSATAQIIVFFFMGQVTQILFGILSDRFGRLLILRIGFPLYIVSGTLAAFSPNLELMYVARFISGIGASAVFMTTIAGVRDRMSGDKMARTMSLIMTIFLFTPIVAPFLGIGILSISNWQVVFLTPPVFAIVIFAWSFRLRESLPAEKRRSMNVEDVVRSIKQVISNRTFLRYTGISTLLFAGLSCYVSSSERIVGEIYHKPTWFVWIFAAIGVIMSCCSLLNSRLTMRYGAKQTIKWLMVAYVGVAAFLLLSSAFTNGMPSMFMFFISLGALMGLNVAVEPNSSAMALEPMGEMAGVASSIYGTIFFFVGSALGALISYEMVGDVFPLVVGFFVIGIFCLVVAFRSGRS